MQLGRDGEEGGLQWAGMGRKEVTVGRDGVDGGLQWAGLSAPPSLFPRTSLRDNPTDHWLVFQILSLQDHCEKWSRFRVVLMELEKKKCEKEGRTMSILYQEHKCAGSGWVAVLPPAVPFSWAARQELPELPKPFFAELL